MNVEQLRKRAKERARCGSRPSRQRQPAWRAPAANRVPARDAPRLRRGRAQARRARGVDPGRSRRPGRRSVRPWRADGGLAPGGARPGPAGGADQRRAWRPSRRGAGDRGGRRPRLRRRTARGHPSPSRRLARKRGRRTHPARHGADLVAHSEADFPTAAAWAALGSKWWRTPGSDDVGVMELLVAAGAELEPRFADVSQGPLEDWLLEAVD